MGLLDDAIREHLDLKRRRGADPSEVDRAERDALGPVRRGPEGSDDVDLDHHALPDDDLDYEEDAAYEQEGPFEEPHELHEPPDFQARTYEREEPRAYEEPRGYEEPAAYTEPPADAEPQDFGGPAATEPPTPPPVSEYTLDQETEAWDSLEPDAPHLVDAPHTRDAPLPAEAPYPADSHAAKAPDFADELDDELSAQAPPEPYAPPSAPEPYTPPPAPAPAEPRESEPPAVDPQATQPHTAEPAGREPHPAEPPGDILGGDTAEFDMELEEIEGEEDVLEETPEFLQDTPDHDRLWFEQRPPKDFDFDE